jgi:hypothetical protein
MEKWIHDSLRKPRTAVVVLRQRACLVALPTQNIIYNSFLKLKKLFT